MKVELNYILRVIFSWTFVISIVKAQAQTTFSNTYHLEVGSDNRGETFFLESGSFVVGTTHSGDTSVVSAFTRFNFDGEITSHNSYSDFVISQSRSLLRTGEEFEISGYRWSLDNNLARGLQLVKVNDELDFIEQDLLFYQEERSTNLPGIVDLNDSLKAIYCSFVKNTTGIDGGAYLGLLNKENDSIQSEVIFRGSPDYLYVEYDVFDLQESIDGNMLFIAETRPSGQNATGSSSEFEIVKFNWEGETLKRIVGKREGVSRAIEQDDNGSVYFSNHSIPYFIDTTVTFPDKGGGL